MAGLIERNAKIPLMLKQRTGIVDGKPVWATVSCTGMVFDFTQADMNYFGAVQNGKIFLVSPLATAPELPGRIVCGDSEYEIKGVKTYRNLRGVLLGYRIAVAGA